MNWLLHTLAGGGALLLLAWAVFSRIQQPARRLRLGLWAIAAALLLAVLSLAPAWLVVRWPEMSAAEPAPVIKAASLAEMPAVVADKNELLFPNWDELQVDPAIVGEPLIQPALQEIKPVEAPAARGDALVGPDSTSPTSPWWPAIIDVSFWAAGILYASTGLCLLARWLFGQRMLVRLLAAAEPVPDRVAYLCMNLTSGAPFPRLLMSRRVRVPFSCGVLRPTIVLPTAMCAAADEAALRWVLAHELAHLRQRDAWASLLFGVGQALYFPLPWFWWLRRQVRLCQEYLADAAAVAATGRREDYAQFLLGWAKAPALPVGATGVSGHSSDLFRRITMLLQARKTVDARCPRPWSLLVAAGMFAMAVLVAGVGLPTGSAQAQDKKAEPKKEVKPGDEQTENELLLDYARNLRLLLNDIRRDNFENPYGIYRPNQPPVMVPGELPCLPTPIGASVEKLTVAMADQLDLKKDVGLLVCIVTDGTPAAKAGLKSHDVLVELNGKEVPGDVGQFLKALDGIKADTPFDAVVLRKGKRETIKGLTIPGAKLRSDLGPRADPIAVAEHANLNDRHALARQVAAATALTPVRLTAVPGTATVQTTSVRTSDKFTSRRQESGLCINVAGKVVEGKSAVTEVTVRDTAGTATFAGIEQVPERYRAQVQALVDLNDVNSMHVSLRKN